MMNTMSTVKAIIQTELHLTPRGTVGITPVTIIRELGANSLDYAGIISEVEEQFGFEIHDDRTFVTVGELVEFIDQALRS